MSSAAQDRVITINDHPYRFSDLSQTAKDQLHSLQATDNEIQRLQKQLAIAQTARNAYAQALSRALPSVSKAALQ